VHGSVNIIISYNSVPLFHKNYVLLISNNHAIYGYHRKIEPKWIYLGHERDSFSIYCIIRVISD